MPSGVPPVKVNSFGAVIAQGAIVRAEERRRQGEIREKREAERRRAQEQVRTEAERERKEKEARSLWRKARKEIEHERIQAAARAAKAEASAAAKRAEEEAVRKREAEYMAEVHRIAALRRFANEKELIERATKRARDRVEKEHRLTVAEADRVLRATLLSLAQVLAVERRRMAERRATIEREVRKGVVVREPDRQVELVDARERSQEKAARATHSATIARAAALLASEHQRIGLEEERAILVMRLRCGIDHA